jgi:hypothetical protein
LYRINIETGEVSDPRYVQKAWIFNGENKPEVIIEQGYEYISALNVGNALKKFKEGKDGFKKSIANPVNFNK